MRNRSGEQLANQEKRGLKSGNGLGVDLFHLAMSEGTKVKGRLSAKPEV